MGSVRVEHGAWIDENGIGFGLDDALCRLLSGRHWRDMTGTLTFTPDGGEGGEEAEMGAMEELVGLLTAPMGPGTVLPRDWNAQAIMGVLPRVRAELAARGKGRVVVLEAPTYLRTLTPSGRIISSVRWDKGQYRMTGPHEGERCPVHGEDYVWRPCVGAGEPYSHDGGGGYYFDVRSCPVPSADTRGDGVIGLAVPEDCARCPVPALVEAVEAAREFIDSPQVQGAFVLQATHGGCQPWEKNGKRIGEYLNAALEAANETKGEK